MARLAQRLPVALIPEEVLVSSVRNDVVNHGCLCVPADLHASGTQWVAFQIKLALLLPAATVATLAGGAGCLRVK